MTFLIPVGAVGEWAVEQDDIYKFDMTTWDDDVIDLDGYFELEITDIDSNGDLTYDISCFFDVDDDDEESSLEKSDVVVSDTFSLSFLIVLLFTVADFETFKADVDNTVIDMNSNYDALYGSNENITYTITELEYGWEISKEDSGLNISLHSRFQWDDKGLLKHWEWTTTDDTGKSGILIKQQGFDIMAIIESIPGYSLGSLLPVLFISVAGMLIVLKRKKKL
ncbi:MAG: hypothetical protein ACTSWW_12500 [Promethearchaeota archaeon]